MKNAMLTMLLVTGLVAQPLHADLYAEFALLGGGDEIIGTNFGDSIDAGGGIKLAIGIQNSVRSDNRADIRLTVGYLFDRIEADNGAAEIDALIFDALYLVNSGPHSFGIGATLHLSPRYDDDIDGFRPLHIEFDDAAGLLLQYGYNIMPGMELGVRLSDLTYKSARQHYDAGGVGVYISNGF